MTQPPVRSFLVGCGRIGAYLLSGLTLASLALLVWPVIPLGVLGEWTWARRAWPEIDALACVGSVLLGAVYWVVVRWGEARGLDPHVRALRRDADPPESASLVWTWGSRLRDNLRIAGLCLLAFVWLFGLLSLQPDVQGLGRALLPRLREETFTTLLLVLAGVAAVKLLIPG